MYRGGLSFYIFNISGTDTFLAGSHTLAGWDLLSGKIRLSGAMPELMSKRLLSL